MAYSNKFREAVCGGGVSYDYVNRREGMQRLVAPRKSKLPGGDGRVNAMEPGDGGM